MAAKKLEDMFFISDLLKVIIENLRNGQTSTQIVSDTLQLDLDLTVTRLGAKSLPKTSAPS